jgi:hypothetical protein
MIEQRFVLVLIALGVAYGGGASAIASDLCSPKSASSPSALSSAEQDANKIALKFKDRGYVVVKVASGDSSQSHNEIIQVPADHDCVLMLGIDNSDARPGLDLIVNDSLGALVAQDRRASLSRACVAFSSKVAAAYEVSVPPSVSVQRVNWVLLMGLRETQDVAGEDAQKIATKFRDRGYDFQSLGSGTTAASAIFPLLLGKGVDCVVLVGVDASASVDLIITDAEGNVVARDVRALKRAAVEFSSATAGTYTVTVSHPPKGESGRFTVFAGTQPTGPVK